MRMISTANRYVWALSLAWCFGLALAQMAAAEPSSAVPPIIQTGFGLWTRGGADIALDAWRKGGLFEDDAKVAVQARYFKTLDRAGD